MGFVTDCQFCGAPIQCPEGAYRWTVLRCASCGLNNAVRNPQPRNTDLDQRRKDYYDQFKLLD